MGLNRSILAVALAVAAAVVAADRPAATGAPATRPIAATAPAVTAVIPAQLLADLDSDQFEVRERASVRLLADNSLALQALADGHARAVSAEQRQRLIDVARHHYLRHLAAAVFDPRSPAAIGIALEGLTADRVAVGKPGLRVNHTFPGFPSYTALQPADVIVGVDGKGLKDASTSDEVFAEFRGLVQAQTPGGALSLSVLRGGRTVEVKLGLAGIEALTSMYMNGQPVLREPFDAAWEQFRKDMEARKATDPPLKVDFGPLKARIDDLRKQPSTIADPPDLPIPD